MVGVAVFIIVHVAVYIIPVININPDANPCCRTAMPRCFVCAGLGACARRSARDLGQWRGCHAAFTALTARARHATPRRLVAAGDLMMAHETATGTSNFLLCGSSDGRPTVRPKSHHTTTISPRGRRSPPRQHAGSLMLLLETRGSNVRPGDPARTASRAGGGVPHGPVLIAHAVLRVMRRRAARAAGRGARASWLARAAPPAHAHAHTHAKHGRETSARGRERSSSAAERGRRNGRDDARRRAVRVVCRGPEERLVERSVGTAAGRDRRCRSIEATRIDARPADARTGARPAVTFDDGTTPTSLVVRETRHLDEERRVVAAPRARHVLDVRRDGHVVDGEPLATRCAAEI